MNFDNTIDLTLSPQQETCLGGTTARRIEPLPNAHLKMSSGTSTRPQLFGEIRELLQRRLSEVGVIGGGTWWLLCAYFLSGVNPVMQPATLGSASLAFVIAPVIAFPAMLAWLIRRPGLSIIILRSVEWVLMLTTLLPLAVWRYSSVVFALANADDTSARFATAYCNFPCTAMIIVYGVFIPNTLRRTGFMLGLMGVGIVVTDLLAWQPYLRIEAFIDAIFQTSVMLFLSIGTAFYGSFKVAELHREARAARAELRELGQYRLLRRLGAGAMGEVYLAEHQFLKRPCAVKLIRQDRAGDPLALVRFEREAQATARLKHPNTVEVFDFGRADDGTFYYVMELLDGLSLEEVVGRRGPLPPGRAVHLLRQLCGALREAHQAGLTHRDIKPSNVLLCRHGGLFDVVKLVDFGLVTYQAMGPETSRMTQAGSVTGTPDYISPEQADGTGADHRSDLYSLGATAYFLLTGQPPYVGKTVLDVLFAHRHQPIPNLSTLVAGAPIDLDAIIARLLAKDPAERYPSAEAVEADLRKCADLVPWSDLDAEKCWSSVAATPLQ